MTAKQLREKRANLHEQQKALLEAAYADDGDGLTPEQEQEFDKRDADIERLGKEIDRLELVERRELELRASQGVKTGGVIVPAETQKATSDDPAERREQENRAFTSFLKYGREGMTAEERAVMAPYQTQRPDLPEERAAQTVTTTGGGYLIPEGFVNQLEEAMLAFGGMREAATILRTASGNDLPWPTVDETAVTGRLLAINTQVTNTAFTVGQVVFGAYKYSSDSVLVPLELLQDSAFDLNSWLARALATRIGRITNTHFTTGTGSAQPNGVVTASTQGKVGTTGQTTTIIYNDLVDLQHSVDPAYRTVPTCRWMFNDASLAIIKKLVDGQSRPLWAPGIVASEPNTILGHPYTINQDVASMAANAKSVLFGDFSKYIIRDVMGIQLFRLVERYMDFAQVGFIAFSRTDGDLVDAGTNPVKHYANSAT